jgi:hypothetical protein
VYVDDVLITGSDYEGILNTCEQIKMHFEIRELGYPTTFVGIQIEKDDLGNLFLHQSKYIESMLQQFGVQATNSVSTPLPPLASHKNVKPVSTNLSFSYRSAIGALLYLANYTRLDIAFAVNFLARYQSNPLDLHWALLMRLFNYLVGTKQIGLSYTCTSNELDVFADADFAGDPRTRRSTTGYVIRLFGCPVTWASRLQPCVAESSGEAEHISICDATHDVLFIARLTEETLGKLLLPVTLYEDSNAAIGSCSKTTSKSRVKHMELRYLKIREYVQNDVLKIVKVESQHQLADILTKGFSNETFSLLRNKLLCS